MSLIYFTKLNELFVNDHILEFLSNFSLNILNRFNSYRLLERSIRKSSDYDSMGYQIDDDLLFNSDFLIFSSFSPESFICLLYLKMGNIFINMFMMPHFVQSLASHFKHRGNSNTHFKRHAYFFYLFTLFLFG